MGISGEGEESSLCRLCGRGLSSSMVVDENEEGGGRYLCGEWPEDQATSVTGVTGMTRTVTRYVR